MRALGLDQPWASLIAAGIKTIETRDWSTTYRGPLAIHANKGWKQDQHDRWLEFSDEFGPDRFPPLPEWLPPRRRRPENLPPLGAIVALATVHDVGRFEADPTGLPGDVRLRFDSGGVMGVPDDDHSTGDTTAGRFGWVLVRVFRLETPYPMRGRQGLWTPELPERMDLAKAPGTWANTCAHCGGKHPDDDCDDHEGATSGLPTGPDPDIRPWSFDP